MAWRLVPGRQSGRLGRCPGVALAGGGQYRGRKDVQNDKADGDRYQQPILARCRNLEFAFGRLFTERHCHVLQHLAESQTGATYCRSGDDTVEG